MTRHLFLVVSSHCVHQMTLMNVCVRVRACVRTRWLQCWNTGSDTDHGDRTSMSWATDLEPVWSAAGSMFTGVSCPTFIVTWPVSSGCVDRAEADPERSPPKTNTGSRTEKTSGPLNVNMTLLTCSLGKFCRLWCNSSTTTTTDDLSGALFNPLTKKPCT